MLSKKLLTAVAVLGLTVSAYAGSQNDAGCGLGSMLFTEDKPVHQIVAATTNGSFGNQTFGITTGTLGCSSGGLIKAGMEREAFVATNYRAIEKEMAAGKGQYASSLSSLMGCGEQTERFLSVSKQNYETLFPSEGASPETLLKNLDRQIASDPALAQACGV
ncbi:MAG: hypothetical protein AUJ52_03770 [Elusimicrobia bacterium CG1_02_63_36]|nr:MAG: hypothetical protein AUJ52_03770 [Elusimicrobia bacterium CG1_02_63_36]PIP83444.1 MAG: hypothetical protein COR54_09975 [Elusimicrobia bacterium CG22_combo_CG10-13_8_21_14_all_63_91]PJA15733.1 MAG: hypothetical protein COX66_09310 [Elusimicrobia bacterium CG_4_10_14_0_2_um_filter_63_34]PJB25394.1 MAG: hypothetical protein CO113_09110 [Elusimicrobia bacterium CG_4_9_14_3_um_filter_62_55]